MVQVSTEGEADHEPPFGLNASMDARVRDTRMGPDPDRELTASFSVDALMAAPRIRPMEAGRWRLAFAGVYEVYVFYRKLKTRRGAWSADRRWWGVLPQRGRTLCLRVGIDPF